MSTTRLLADHLHTCYIRVTDSRQRRYIKGYVANPPTFGPLLILSPALKFWGPPKTAGVK